MERQELKSDKGFSLDIICRERGALMGLAACYVLFLHFAQVFGVFGTDFMQNLESFFFVQCESGVDLFLLLSGFGLYYSLDKSFNLKGFYKKRFIRVFPEYLIALLIAAFLWEDGMVPFLLRLCTLKFWVFKELTFWYIALISVLYLIFPVIYRIIKKSTGSCVVAVLILLLTAFPLNMLGEVYTSRIIAFDRIPVFMAGALLAKGSKNKDRLYHKDLLLVGIIVMLLSAICSEFTDTVHYRLFYLPLAVCLCVTAGYGFSLIKDNNPLKKMLMFLGRNSLAIYLNAILLYYLKDKSIIGTIPSVAVQIPISLVIILAASFVITSVCDAFRKNMIKTR